MFVDKTWINADHFVTKSWTEKTLVSGRKELTDKGERLIIGHAGILKICFKYTINIFSQKTVLLSLRNEFYNI